jgi:hypothetical protein
MSQQSTVSVEDVGKASADGCKFFQVSSPHPHGSWMELTLQGLHLSQLQLDPHPAVGAGGRARSATCSATARRHCGW